MAPLTSERGHHDEDPSMNDHFVKEMIELLELVAKVMFENFISFHSG